MALPDDLRALAGRVSNWGRWGDDDQRGTLNLVTPAAVLRGVAAVRTGRVFSLAIACEADGPMWDTASMPGRVNPTLDPYMVNVSFTGDRADFTTSDDAFTMGSQAATHWDGLAHVGYEGKLYNDVDAEVVTAAGASRLGVEHLGPVVTRGVLLDVARLHAVDCFDDAHPITGAELDATAAAAGVEIEPGDAVLVRTGQMRHRGESKQRYSHPSPGLSTRSIEWFRDHDVAAVATDTQTFECYPGDDERAFFPVHMIHLRDMGLLQGQLWALDELAADCAADGQHTFLLCASPLPLVGAVGAPVVPTAVK